MAKKIILSILSLFLVCGLISCKNTESVVTMSFVPRESPHNVQNELQSHYDKMNCGSCKKLEGKCLFISIFLSDQESSFTEKEKETSNSKLEQAINFLLEESEKYNATFEPIYNKPDTLLNYTVTFNVATDYSDPAWAKSLLKDIYNQYHLEKILERYHADNVGYIYKRCIRY